MSEKYTLNANGPEREQVKANVHAFIDRLPAHKSFLVEIKEARKERTPPQNAALWGLAYPRLTEATGYTPDELHHEFCGRFFGWDVVTVFGQQRRRPRRTTTTNEQGEREVLGKRDFAEFYNLVQRIAAEAGIDVPDPDPFHGEQRWAA
ncbi:MAG: hypothetical protein GAK28_02438 [Luteibacter sp.]|uniref:hypothetical protein n=1 Tax=Luteibacter sp. TaxID=1886636 RepID=UPI00138304DE|nr:hypothetical protein [Luteibacter sp.]KAF1006762.1 MAG: hypothetical protein GAK28_02438 [Luteibacter sp.]